MISSSTSMFSTPGTKLAPIPWMPCGLALPPCKTGDLAGSTATTRTPGTSCFNTSPTPVMVPPLPTPPPRHKSVDLPLSRLQDLSGGCQAVDFRVGRIEKLLRHEVAGIVRYQRLGGVDGATHPLDGWGQDQLRPEPAHQCPSLHAHVFRHRQDQAVPFDRRHHRKADPGVSGSRLDDRVARLQAAPPLPLVDHRQGDAILDPSPGFQRLKFCKDPSR